MLSVNERDTFEGRASYTDLPLASIWWLEILLPPNPIGPSWAFLLWWCLICDRKIPKVLLIGAQELGIPCSSG
jgi:hypothetical protein